MHKKTRLNTSYLPDLILLVIICFIFINFAYTKWMHKSKLYRI